MIRCGRRECVGYTDSFEGIWLITVMEKMAAKAQHNVDFGYWIMMNITGILAIKSRDMEWLIGDVTEIKLRPNVMNWERRFSLSKMYNSYPVPENNKVAGIQKREKDTYLLRQHHLTPTPTPTGIRCISGHCHLTELPSSIPKHNTTIWHAVPLPAVW